MLPSFFAPLRCSLRQVFPWVIVAIAGANPAIAQSLASSVAHPVTSPVNHLPISQTKQALTFDQLMNIGYAASRQGDFNTALINFRRALALQPNQPYAQAAADNMVYYIYYERTAPRRRAISQLEARLATATSQKDWVCAATTLDQLATYAEPNSLNQERLIGQRGEISGLLDARINYERWSTVCTAAGPVY